MQFHIPARLSVILLPVLARAAGRAARPARLYLYDKGGL